MAKSCQCFTSSIFLGPIVAGAGCCLCSHSCSHLEMRRIFALIGTVAADCSRWQNKRPPLRGQPGWGRRQWPKMVPRKMYRWWALVWRRAAAEGRGKNSDLCNNSLNITKYICSIIKTICVTWNNNDKKHSISLTSLVNPATSSSSSPHGWTRKRKVHVIRRIEGSFISAEFTKMPLLPQEKMGKLQTHTHGRRRPPVRGRRDTTSSPPS